MTGRVLVTGAAGALGSVVAPTLRAAGHAVLAVDRQWPSPDGPDQRTLDLGSAADTDQLFAQIARTEPLHGVAHLVGGFAMGKEVHEATDADWDAMWQLNVSFAVRVVRAALPLLRARGTGSLVLVSAATALPGAEPDYGVGPYVVSKAAVASLVRVTAAELVGTGVRINAIAPTIIDTPANRAAMPDADPQTWVPRERIAETIAYLLSDAAQNVTGQVIRLS